MRPVIGITCGDSMDPGTEVLSLPASYTRSVYRAGGLPVLIAPPRDAADPEEALQALERLDGLLIPGGVDVSSGQYGENPHPALGRINPDLDALEMPLIQAALRRDLPLLAICRGIQALNVAAGGTLVQDLPAQAPGCIQHRQLAARWHASHSVAVTSSSRLARILGGERAEVNSFHHQAVSQVAPGFVVTAAAPDGVVEAIESPDHPFALGVQWHPEGMWERHPVMLELFTALVRAAAPAGAAKSR